MISINHRARTRRFPFLLSALIPILKGKVVVGYRKSPVHLLLFLLIAAAALSINLETNLFNDYGDHFSRGGAFTIAASSPVFMSLLELL
jgi:1,4-dihydroxy-2-naphthoate octaprenyltransferase